MAVVHNKTLSLILGFSLKKTLPLVFRVLDELTGPLSLEQSTCVRFTHF